MTGTRGVGVVLAAIGISLALASSGCSKSSNAEGTTAVTSSSEGAPPKSGRPSRSEVACRLHSCSPPYFCNEDKGVCERLRCLESRDCPYDYKCDFSLNVCQ